jgi:hypothetical protein
LKLVPFGHLAAPLAPVEFVGMTPKGKRLIGPIVGARLEGPHIQASQSGTSAADWLIQSADGTVLVDVRLSLRTDDGAELYVAYSGRADWSGGIGCGPVYSAFRFDSEHARYRWLQTRLIVGKGNVEIGRGRYDLYITE